MLTERTAAAGGWRIVAAFAATQTVGYGILYYAFAVLFPSIAVDLHCSTTVVTGAFTCSVLAGAALTVPVGRWLDRRGGRALMTTGSVLATALLVAWSQVQHVWQLYAVLTGIGCCGAMVLYDPAFAVVVSWFDPRRRGRALLTVTVAAGFASAVFLPLTGALLVRYGWRGTVLDLAVLHGVITVPLHAIVVRRAPGPGHARHPREKLPDRRTVVTAARHDPRFWALTAAFVAHGAAMTTMTVHLVGFLTSEGHSATFAANVAGLLGVLSVTGRLALTGAQSRIRTTTAVAAIMVTQAVAAFSLPFIGRGSVGAAVGVIAFGVGFGVASLATPALLAGRYGTTAYATIAGTLSAPVTVAKATAPLAAAALYHAVGYAPVLAAVGCACLLAAVGIAARASSPSPVGPDTVSA